jgi:hypothetical protein
MVDVESPPPEATDLETRRFIEGATLQVGTTWMRQRNGDDQDIGLVVSIDRHGLLDRPVVAPVFAVEKRCG